MATAPLSAVASRWELAAEMIAVRVRWFGLLVGYVLVNVALPADQRSPVAFLLTVVVLGWVSWASSSLALLLKRVGDHLGRLNAALHENQAQLEARIAERTEELQEAQARLLHQ